MKNFRDTIDAFAKSPIDDSMSRLIDHVEHYPPTDEDIAYLALCLSESGKTISELGELPTADIPSTGGPSSLSTILCPLYLRALGYVVPKLGVPGRLAGGIDVLTQIQGYKIDFTNKEVERLLKESGYIHFLASRTFTPLDAILFSYRKRSNKVNIPELAIASLLSKKKAAAVSLVGLDVRVAPHGNFGTSFTIASQNAKRFCSIAQLLGIQAKCFLSDASVPYQPFIGRGEALTAIFHIIAKQADPWLRDHDDACYGMVNRLIQVNAKSAAITRPCTDKLFSVFKDNLEVQGSSFACFEDYVHRIKKEHKLHLIAQEDGFLYVDLESLRSLMVQIQNRFSSPERLFPDPCGIILKHKSGIYVYKGDILATVRCADNLSGEMLRGAAAALRVMHEPIPGIHFREVSYV